MSCFPGSQAGPRTGFFRAVYFGRRIRSGSHVEFVSINMVSNTIANHVRGGSAQSVFVLAVIHAIRWLMVHLWGPCRQQLKRLRWCRMHLTPRNSNLVPASLYATSPLAISRLIANCKSCCMNVLFCGVSRGFFSSLLLTSIVVSNNVSGGLSFGCCEMAGTRIVRMISAVPSSTTFTLYYAKYYRNIIYRKLLKTIMKYIIIFCYIIKCWF